MVAILTLLLHYDKPHIKQLQRESNSKLAAVTAQGSHNTRPPIHTGRTNTLLSKSLAYLSVAARINFLKVVREFQSLNERNQKY